MSETKEEIKQEGDFKVKKKPKMKNLGSQDEVIKVDLSKPVETIEQYVAEWLEENKDE